MSIGKALIISTVRTGKKSRRRIRCSFRHVIYECWKTLDRRTCGSVAERLGDDMRFTVLRKDGELLGFVTTVKDGETAVGYYIGFDRKRNAEV